jgi:hypothetical protein
MSQAESKRLDVFTVNAKGSYCWLSATVVSNNADDALKLCKDLVNARYGDDEINLGGKTAAD